MCSAVPATPGTQTIAQLLKKAMDPVPAQPPAATHKGPASTSPQDTLEISAAAEQMAATKP